MEKTLLGEPATKRWWCNEPASVSSSLKIINCLASITFFFYYWIALGPNWKSVEIVQILFLSILLVLVAVPLSETTTRRLLVISTYVVTAAWLFLLAVLWSRELNLSLLFQVSVFVCGMLWASGIVLACSCCERKNLSGEVDLILYLLVLNVVTAWSPVDAFNIELHLILDMRTFMLVYNCLHQLQKNEELLQYPSFVSVVALTITTFFLSKALFGKLMGKATDGVSILVFLLFGIIGIIVLVEVWNSGKLRSERDAGVDGKPATEDEACNGSGNVGSVNSQNASAIALVVLAGAVDNL